MRILPPFQQKLDVSPPRLDLFLRFRNSWPGTTKSTLRCSCCSDIIGDGIPDVAPELKDVDTPVTLCQLPLSHQVVTHQDRSKDLKAVFTRECEGKQQSSSFF